MTASERLYELARGGEGIHFSSAEVLALASLVEAAEHEHPEPHNYWATEVGASDVTECPTCVALTALRDALQGEAGSPPPPEGATAP